jgi:hypothetical protein
VILKGFSELIPEMEQSNIFKWRPNSFKVIEDIIIYLWWTDEEGGESTLLDHRIIDITTKRKQ